MEYRTIRQTILILIPFTILLAAIIYVYYRAQPSPTCFDKVKNQDETGIDCGGSCMNCALKTKQPLKVFYVKFDEVSQGLYDVVAEVRNPNIKLSAAVIPYEITLRDKSGFTIEKISGSSYIYPLETVHVIEAGIRAKRTVAKVEFKITDSSVMWDVREDIKVPDLIGGDKEVLKEARPDGSVITILNAKIFNRSILDYDAIEVAVLITDAEQNVIAVSKTVIAKVRGGEFSPIVFSWQGDVPIDINKAIIEPRLNLLKK